MGGGEGGEGEYIYVCGGTLLCQVTRPERGEYTAYGITRLILLHNAAHNAVSLPHVSHSHPPYTHLFEERLPLVQRVHLSLVQRRVVRHRVLGVQRRHPCPPHSQPAKHQHSSRTHSPSPLLPSLPANTLYPLPGAYISPREETSNTLPLIAT